MQAVHTVDRAPASSANDCDRERRQVQGQADHSARIQSERVARVPEELLQLHALSRSRRYPAGLQNCPTGRSLRVLGRESNGQVRLRSVERPVDHSSWQPPQDNWLHSDQIECPVWGVGPRLSPDFH